ncbi:MAG: lysine--tRNA ligase, partial [Treponema socranskii subsp. buccale]
AMPSVMPYQIGFRMLTTLLQTYSGDIDAVIASLGDVRDEQKDCLKRRCECAWYWITECAPEDFKFALRLGSGAVTLSDAEKAVVEKMKSDVLPFVESSGEQELSQKIYDAAVGCGIKPKELFGIMYRVLIGKEQGPRLASFMKIIGKEKLERILSNY